jgi:hypothetical protein
MHSVANVSRRLCIVKSQRVRYVNVPQVTQFANEVACAFIVETIRMFY